MVEYLMRERLETEEQVRERLEGLRVRLMKAEKEDNKVASTAIKGEISICNGLLDKVLDVNENISQENIAGIIK